MNAALATVKFGPQDLAAKTGALAGTLAVAEAFAVVDVGTAEAATVLIRVVKDEAKALEEMRTSAGKPLLEAKRTLDGWFKPNLETCARIEKVLKAKLGAWQIEERRRADAALLAAAQAHVAGDAATANQALVVVNTAHTDAPAGTTVREVWQAQIVDAAAVPRDWCVPDEKRIAAYARGCPAGQAPLPIAGVVFQKVPAVAVRT